MKSNVIFSTGTDEYETPQHIFDSLDAEFQFDLDPCATDKNHKCDHYLTKEDDGLYVNWGASGPL